MNTAIVHERSRRHSVAWWTVIVLSWVVVLYGALYLILRQRMFPPQLVASFTARPWGIYSHVMVGMIALAIGPLQFHPRMQAHTAWHRNMGTTYVIIGLLVGVVGLYMSIFSFGGMITHTGFGCLAAGVFVTTLQAYRNVRAGRWRKHREWMIRSYSLLFAAPTLRVLLPLLIISFKGDFLPAYRIVSWLCWVPNIIAAEWYVRRSRSMPLRFAGRVMAED